MHLPRPRRDVDTDRAFKTVWLPLDHVAVLCARPDEAVSVAFVSTVLASAEARDVAGDLGMFRCELKRRRDHFDGPRWCVSLERNRRKVCLFMWAERRLRLRRRDDFRRRISALGKFRSIGRRHGPVRRRRRRFGSIAAAPKREHGDADHGDRDQREKQRIRTRPRLAWYGRRRCVIL